MAKQKLTVYETEEIMLASAVDEESGAEIVVGVNKKDVSKSTTSFVPEGETATFKNTVRAKITNKVMGSGDGST